jgi:hypothetical protein
MPNGAAPIVFVSYAHDSTEHKDLVLAFATFLRVRIGLDAKLDQWDDNVRRDWALWATTSLREADFVIVVASPEYRKRADGQAAAHVGRGSQFEAAILRNALTEDLGAATERILPVVLPGGSVDDIPTFLNPHSTTHFKIGGFTRDGVAELLAAITGIGAHPLPRRGVWLGGTDTAPGLVPAADKSRWLAHSPAVRVGDASIDGVRYTESIVVRSGHDDGVAFVEIDLGGGYQRFTSVVGVLDDARQRFQVGQFRVSLDGKPLAEGSTALGKPRDVEVSVLGGMTLRLETVRAGGPADLAWGDPALS